MASCPTARRSRSSRRPATSSGCACHGSIRRACSARCSTATPAPSGSRPPESPCPPRGATCRGRWCSRRAGAQAPGWIIVRDVLLIGGWHHDEDRSNTHRRAPTDYDADHVLLRTVRCVNGEVEVDARLRAGLRLRPQAREWEYSGAGYNEGVATAEGVRREAEADDRPAARVRGRSRGRPAPDEGGRADLLRALLVRAPAARELRRCLPEARLDRAPLAALARPRQLPRPPVADVPAARRADAERADVRADRGAARGRDDVAARDAAGRAQLGLPLQLDPRFDVHAVGAVHARLRLGGERLLLLHRRRRRPARRTCR